MSLPPDLLFRKTDLALDELGSRSRRLNARQRQILILLDGHRRLAQLRRMLPDADLADQLDTLEASGFIERAVRARDGPIDIPAIVPETMPSPMPSSHVAEGRGDDPEPLPRVRQRLVRALLDIAGPNGDVLATRIERCSTIDELRSLVAPAASIVEAVAGLPASEQFLARVGRV